jgi:probable H4MPT-linked C1 transfer pathway protein
MVIGWDVGGAHLKAARVERGDVVDVIQLPCTLWLGIEAIDAALASVWARWPDARGARHAVTMTGEMVDLFPDRQAGVDALVAHLAQALGARTRFVAGDVWLDAGQARAAWRDVASANWRATATWIGGRLDEALLIDVGSTTTDIIPVRRGAVAARGATDAARLQTGELLYQGVVRTPLCALAQRVRFRGSDYNVMNEWFATSADVYRLTGELDPSHDQHDTADHRGKDRAATCARLARLLGHDAGDASEAQWLDLARTLRAAQMRLIEESVQRVLVASGLATDAPVVAAGCGDFLAREIAARMGRRCVMFDRLLGAGGAAARWARVCAPSAAVALLLEGQPEPQPAGLACGS